MSIRFRRVGAVMAVVLSVVMGWGGLAWACTAQPKILSVSPVAATEGVNAEAAPGAGTAVIVTGDAVASEAPVEIRWNAATGPAIGVATSDTEGNFIVPATIPEASPGIYYVVATIDGVGVSRMAYEVTNAGSPFPSPGALTTNQLWSQTPSQAPDGGLAMEVALGVGLMAVGLVALFAGFTFVTVRTQAAKAQSHSVQRREGSS